MLSKCEWFNVLTINSVFLVGSGFGILTGFAYSESFWWAGAIAAIACSFPASKIFLGHLGKLSNLNITKRYAWLRSSVTGVICGTFCALVSNSVMTVVIFDSGKKLIHQMDGFWLLFFSIGIGVGAAAGLILGGVLSYVYFFILIGKRNETNELL